MNELVSSEDNYKMSPEILEVANVYLQTNSIHDTALALDIPTEKVNYYINKPEAKRYIDNVFLDQGYLNRHKLIDKMSEIIDKKLEELDEAEMGSTKDIADLLQIMHKMRMDYAKEAAPEKEAGNSTNININGNAGFGTNYNDLLGRITNGSK